MWQLRTSQSAKPYLFTPMPNQSSSQALDKYALMEKRLFRNQMADVSASKALMHSMLQSVFSKGTSIENISVVVNKA